MVTKCNLDIMHILGIERETLKLSRSEIRSDRVFRLMCDGFTDTSFHFVHRSSGIQHGNFVSGAFLDLILLSSIRNLFIKSSLQLNINAIVFVTGNWEDPLIWQEKMFA